MSNETKRDVVLQLAKENRDTWMYDPECIEPKELIEQDYQDWIRDYDAALPDNLPVIPEAVGEILQSAHRQDDLLTVLGTAKNGYKVSDTLAWIIDNQNTFAHAWLDGVWRVEETGEVVKLEAEK